MIWIGAAFLLLISGFLVYRRMLIRDIGSPVFSTLYEQAINEVVDTCEEANLTYWFTEGTLIGLLRYGRNDPDRIDQVVDDDIDIMIETASHQEWLEVSDFLNDRLQALGWKRGKRYSTFKKKGARPDKLQCWKYGARFKRTHVDFHNYLVDKERRVCYSHGNPESYPFETWNGYMPLDLIYPLKTCLCYGRPAPCPNRPIEVLKKWHGGEYDTECLGLPPRAVNDHELSVLRDYARQLHEAGHCSMYEELKTYLQSRTIT